MAQPTPGTEHPRTARVDDVPSGPALQAAIVGIVAVAVYLTSLPVPFLNWDDNLYVTMSPRTQAPGLTGFLALWNSDAAWDGRIIEFFPLRDSIYWALWQIFGRNPVPFHVVNVVLHAVTAVLVLRLAKRLGFSTGVAFWGALIFAVHPVHVESVTWIAALKDPLFTSLMLGSLLAYTNYRESRRPLYYALSLALMVASLLAKSFGIVTPLLIIAIERFSGAKTSWRLIAARVAAPSIIAAVFTLQFVLIGRAAGVITPPHGGSWGSHVFLSLWAFVRYVQQAFVPSSFAILHCFEPLEGWNDPRWLGIGALGAGTIALAVFAYRREHRTTLLLIAWFFAALLPVANIVPFPALMADRYLYAPSFATSVGTALLLAAISRPLLRNAALIAVVVVLGATTTMRNIVWHEEANLWREVAENDACLVDTESTSAVAFLKHATSHPPAIALKWFEKGLNHPGFGRLPADARCDYLRAGSLYAVEARNPGLAIDWARRSTNICPFLPKPWNTLALVSATHDPQLAADAALRAYRLHRSAQNLWYVGQTRVAAGNDAGFDDLNEAVSRAPKQLCGIFRTWSSTLDAARRERLMPAYDVCAREPQPSERPESPATPE